MWGWVFMSVCLRIGSVCGSFRVVVSFTASVLKTLIPSPYGLVNTTCCDRGKPKSVKNVLTEGSASTLNIASFFIYFLMKRDDT